MAVKKFNALIIATYGWPGHTSQVTEQRIAGAERLIKEGWIPHFDLFIPFPQGWCKEHPNKKPLGLKQPLPLGEAVAALVRENPTLRRASRATLADSSSYGISTPHQWKSWSTFGDEIGCYRMIKDQNIYHKPVHVDHVSDKDHLERIKMIWDITHPRGWTANFFAVETSRTDAATWEPRAYRGDMLRSWIYRLSLGLLTI